MEQFVTFEIGKKLKEKGFIHGYNRYGYKPIYSDVNTIKFIWDIGGYEKGYFGENIPCPTIEQILKWLRDEKDIFIEITVDVNDKFNYYFGIYKKGNDTWEYIGQNDTYNYFEMYEEAALAGVKYTLDNLI